MDPVFLEPVGASLVAPLTRPDLSSSDRAGRSSSTLFFEEDQALLQHKPGLAQIRGSLAAGNDLDDPTRPMRQTTAILVLVAMLATLARATEPGNLEFIVNPALRGCRHLVEHCYCAGARVDPATALRRRHSLDTVTARLVSQAAQILAVNLNGQL